MLVCTIINNVKQPSFVCEDPEQALQGVIDVLNAGPSKRSIDPKGNAHRHLVELVRAWQEAKNATHPLERGDFPGGIPGLLKMKCPPGSPNLGTMADCCRVIIAPGKGLSAYVSIVYAPQRPWTSWDLACQQFIRLITSSVCERIGGPCPRCGKYFSRAGKKQKRFCSRTCASVWAALESTMKTRQRQRADKFRLIEQAKCEWEKEKVRTDWKQWICKAYPEITPKFLTRAVNEGKLSEPGTKRK